MSEPIYEGVAWIYKMFITFIVAFVAIAIVSYTVVNDINTREVQAGLMINRLLYSPDGFWYKVDGQLQPGIVDGTLIDNGQIQAILDRGFAYKEGYGGMRITIIPKPQQQVGSPPLFGPYYIEKDTYVKIQTQVAANVKNSGTYEQHNYPVIIKRSGSEIPAIMQVELVLPELA